MNCFRLPASLDAIPVDLSASWDCKFSRSLRSLFPEALVRFISLFMARKLIKGVVSVTLTVTKSDAVIIKFNILQVTFTFSSLMLREIFGLL